jgi:dTDP-4-dehydrorhamnose 3,5-epimerase-like enzyme
LMEFTPDAKRAFHLQTYGPAPVIDGVTLVPLARHVDDGGAMTELVRLNDGLAEALSGFTIRQVNISELSPGAVKAFHLHVRQTDVWYVGPGDRMLVVLIDTRRGSSTEGVRMRLVLGDGSSRLLRIPPDHLLHRPALLGRAGVVRRGSAAVGLRRQRRVGDHPRVR